MKTLIVYFLKILVYMYGFSISLFAVYFNYLYARSHGLIAWIFFGEIVSTFWAMIWPIYFLFFN